MTTKTSYQIPFDMQITDKNRNDVISFPWHQWTGNAGKALDKLREAAEAMTELDPGTATASDCATVLEALRAKLQEIT
jgi:hypothetical protein